MGETDDRRRLSALDATLMVAGGILGVGIFFNPSAVAQRVPEDWAFLALWGVGGLVALCAAFTFAELGATFPRSGGWFVFLREAFGPFPAFLFAWVVLFVVSTGALAAITQFCAGQMVRALPAVVGEQGIVPESWFPVLVVLFWTGVTLFGVKSGAMLQNVCMVLKLCVVAALVIAGFAWVDPGVAAATAPEVVTPVAPLAEGSRWSGMVSALLPVFFSYGGWQMVCYVAPEVRDPERVLPRAILVGVCAVIVVYLLLNLAFLRVLGIEAIAQDSSFAATFAQEAFGGRGERILAAGMAVSAFGICGVNVIVTPWLYVAMARERLFFQSVGRLSPGRGVPVLALGIQAALVLVYVFVARLTELVDSVVFVEWIFHGLVALGLLRLRRTRPDLPRPFRSFAYPLAPLVYAAMAILVVGHTLLFEATGLKAQGLVVVTVGALVYAPWRRLVARGG